MAKQVHKHSQSVSPWPYLGLPYLVTLDCALSGCSLASLRSRRGTMGFSWSGEFGNGSYWATHYVPCHAEWVGPTVLLCILALLSMMCFSHELLTSGEEGLSPELLKKNKKRKTNHCCFKERVTPVSRLSIFWVEVIGQMRGKDM